MTSSTLRAVVHRLTTTPVEQLPSIASFLATSLSDCAELLSAPQTQKPGKSDSNHAVQIHKLKTRLASLLQDRSVEGRWTAVVLVKATVEAGQWEVLRGYESVVRNLIGILGKPDPVSTRKMCIITLTRIFHLTHQYPTLVREITTPHLPGFINAALNLVSVLVKLPSGSSRKAKPNSPFMETVLHAFLELIARHPTIFRPFGPQLRTLLVEIVGSLAPAYFPEQVVDVAQELFVSIHKCAPKDKSGSSWADDCRSTILSIHRTTDHVFRAVIEQWESVDPTLVPTRQNYSLEMGDEGPDSLGLSGWTGVHAGADRLIMILQMLSDFVSMPSSSAVALPLGSILDLTSRLTSVTVPPENADPSQNGVQLNPQIGRDEREALWSELPRIHTACMGLLSTVAEVLEMSTTPIMQSMLEQAAWVFRNESFSKDLRSAIYNMLCSLLSLNGPAMTRQNVIALANILRSCCFDLLSSVGDASAPTKVQSDPKLKQKAGQATANADSFLNPEIKKAGHAQIASRSTGPQRGASRLLQTVLMSVAPELLPSSVRAEIDRAIIMTADKDAMLASVLNPVPAVKGRGVGSSIIPFLVRSYADQMEIEALIRPRMPVLMSAPELDAYDELVEEEEAEEMAEDTYNPAPETADFLKQPVSAPMRTQKVELSAPSDPATSVHKRSYTEESTLSPAPLKKEDVQTKKARLDETLGQQQSFPATERSITAASQPVTATEPPASTVQVEEPGRQMQNAVTHQPTHTTTAPLEQLAASQSTGAAQGSLDDSDDELPALNIEPDTDEDEEDDVSMDS